MSDLYGVTPQQMRDQSWVDPGEIRAEVMELLTIARAARDQAPWDRRIHYFYAMVFPQMTRWLPADEAEQLCIEFERELDRLEALLTA
jgi:hypothetical protein